jgi:hypothetical protein
MQVKKKEQYLKTTTVRDQNDTVEISSILKRLDSVFKISVWEIIRRICEKKSRNMCKICHNEMPLSSGPSHGSVTITFSLMDMPLRN